MAQIETYGKRNIYLNLHKNELILNKVNQEIIVSAVKQGNIDDFSHQKTLRSHACASRVFFFFAFSCFVFCFLQ